MTPEERAAEAFPAHPHLRHACQKAIQEAVADERERCAKIAEETSDCIDPTMGCHERVAKKIREGGAP